MSYFKKFPLTTYSLDGTSVLITDILRRSAFLSSIQNLLGVYSEYDIIDGERPEMVASKFYESPNFHWVILMFNEIHNPYFQWPMSQLQLDDYCREVYGDNLYSVHHYERDGFVIGESKEYDKEAVNYVWEAPENPGPQDPSVYPVSIVDYENNLNEARRSVKILRVELLPEFIKQFEASISGPR